MKSSRTTALFMFSTILVATFLTSSIVTAADDPSPNAALQYWLAFEYMPEITQEANDTLGSATSDSDRARDGG